MSSSMLPKPILGTHLIGDTVRDAGFAFIDRPEDVVRLLNAFHARGYIDLDTARAYGPNTPGASEQRVGAAVKALPELKVHTKIFFSGHGSSAGDHEAGKIEESIDVSLKDLGMSKVSTMFLHVPDRQTPFHETIAAMDKAYKAEKFEQWGLCNYTAAEVMEILIICQSKGYVKPAVYQGQYNAICRGGEETLFPLLRENNMAFWAYSPGAMGLFSAVNKTAGRWDPNVSSKNVAPISPCVNIHRPMAARSILLSTASLLYKTLQQKSLMRLMPMVSQGTQLPSVGSCLMGS